MGTSQAGPSGVNDVNGLALGARRSEDLAGAVPHHTQTDLGPHLGRSRSKKLQDAARQ